MRIKSARTCRKSGKHEGDPRESLLDAGEALFAKHGLKGASTREIAAKARCNVALISYYFKGKEGLYEAIISRHITRVREDAVSDASALAQAWPELAGAAERRLCGFLHAILEGIHQRPSMQRIMMHEMTSGARTLTQALAKAERSSGLGRIISEIQKGMESGEFRNCLDPRFAALTLMAPLTYSCVGQSILKNAYGFTTLDGGFRRQLCIELTKTAFQGWRADRR